MFKRKVLKRYTFKFLFLFLFIFRHCRKWQNANINTRNILLFAFFDGLGDITLLRHPLQTVINQRKDLDISIIVKHKNYRNALVLMPKYIEVIPFESWFDLRKKLYKRKFEYGFNLVGNYSLVQIIVMFFLRVKHWTGIYSNLYGAFLDYPIAFSNQIHFQESIFKLFRSIDVAAEPFKAISAKGVVAKPPEVDKWIDKSELPLIAFHPGARGGIHQNDKRWPAIHYGELAKKLIKFHNVRVVVFGTYPENDLIREIVTRSEGQVKAIVDCSIEEILHILEHCDLLVGNNSGLLHLAVLVGTPTISFSGSVAIKRWGPAEKSNKHFVVPNSWGNLEDRSLNKKKQAEMKMRSINSAKIVPVVLKQLENFSKRYKTN